MKYIVACNSTVQYRVRYVTCYIRVRVCDVVLITLMDRPTVIQPRLTDALGNVL